MKHAATMTVNGMAYPVEIDGDATLVRVLRDQVGLTGTKEGCDDCECGACMVMVDDRPVNSCTYLALQAEGSEITTVEGLADGETLSELQSAFLDEGGVQCGYCTPGMVMSAVQLLQDNPTPTEVQIREGLEGNLCRCTGYHNIVRAIQQAAAKG
jgi:carbon-monoxide dehydrogenase small subunit